MVSILCGVEEPLQGTPMRGDGTRGCASLAPGYGESARWAGVSRAVPRGAGEWDTGFQPVSRTGMSVLLSLAEHTVPKPRRSEGHGGLKGHFKNRFLLFRVARAA